MNHKLLYLLVVLFCATISFAQNNNVIKAMEHEIAYATHDTTRLKLLIHLVDSIYDEQIWPRYNEQAFELGKRLSSDPDPQIQRVAKIYFADAISNRGFLKDNLGDHTAALLEYFEALKIREEIGYKRGIASSFNNIGTVFKSQGDLNRALDYFQKSYQLRVQNSDKSGMARSLNHIGDVYKLKGDYDTALKILLLSMEIYNDLGNVAGTGNAMRNISDIYILKGQYDLAKQYIEQCIDKISALNYTQGLIEAKLRLGKIHFYQKKYDETINIGNECVKIAEANQFIEPKNVAFELLYKAYEAKANYKLAYTYLQKYSLLKDSLNDPIVRSNALEQQLQYEYGKKEAERLAEQEKKDTHSKNVRNYLIISCIGLFLFAGVLISSNVIRIKANKALEEKNKIIAQEKKRAEDNERYKTQFLSNISHEIRTPMNAILGMSDLLATTPLNEPQSKYVNAIRRSSENLLVIVNDVLDFSKLEAGKTELENHPFKPMDVINDVYNTLKFKVEEKGIRFELVTNTLSGVMLLGDHIRLYQILMNLVGNAIKFTEKGSVTLSAEVINKVASQSKTIRYTIKDTGIGIAPEKIGTIFESFQQAIPKSKNKYGGTGLGLSIAQQLVELRGSKIYVESVLNVGSTFHFDMEYKVATEKDIIEHQLKNNTEEIKQIRNIKILLAEDNEYNQIVAVESLIKHIENCEVQVANNGQEVLSLYKNNDYDIILMDINMPIMDGYEVAAAIRNKFPSPKANIPMIALTAYSFEEQTKYQQYGMNAVITKPFKTDYLINLIGTLVPDKAAMLQEQYTSPYDGIFKNSDDIDISFLREFTEDDIAQMQYFIFKFVTNAPKELGLIALALEQQDCEKLRKI